MISECALLLFAVSSHIGASVDYNETHPMLGVGCESWSVGAYVNSRVTAYYANGNYVGSKDNNDISVWAAKRWSGEIIYGEVGLATGYGTPILPLLRAGIDLGNVEVFAGPGWDSYDESVMGIVGVQFKLEM